MARGAKPGSRGKPREPSRYEKRIEKYLAAHPGATRQEARGHGPIGGVEHIRRRERELERQATGGGLTTYNKRRVREIADDIAKRTGEPQQDVRDRLLAAATRDPQLVRELPEKWREWAASPRVRAKRRKTKDGRNIVDVRFAPPAEMARKKAEMDAWAAARGLPKNYAWYKRRKGGRRR